jgi:hypothetical protein
LLVLLCARGRRQGAPRPQSRMPWVFRITAACLRGLGAHRRAQIGPQRSDRMRAEQGPKRVQEHQVAFCVDRHVRCWFSHHHQHLKYLRRTPGGRGAIKISSFLLIYTYSAFLFHYCLF